MRYDQCVNILKRFVSTVIYVRAVHLNNVLQYIVTIVHVVTIIHVRSEQ